MYKLQATRNVEQVKINVETHFPINHCHIATEIELPAKPFKPEDLGLDKF